MLNWTLSSYLKDFLTCDIHEISKKRYLCNWWLLSMEKSPSENLIMCQSKIIISVINNVSVAWPENLSLDNGSIHSVRFLLPVTSRDMRYQSNGMAKWLIGFGESRQPLIPYDLVTWELSGRFYSFNNRRRIKTSFKDAAHLECIQDIR